MPFADPHVCPDCQQAIDGQNRCPHCRLDLTSVPARRLWQTLQQADALLREARSVDAAVASAPTAEPERGAVSVTAGLPTYDQSPRAKAVHPSPGLSPGSILLGLGALFILVAGFIFVTVSWGSLGVAGRALILLAFTALAAGLARWVSRRGLAGSAEALWAVFLGLVTLDWFAAYSQGLLGLDKAPYTVIAIVWTALIFALASLVVVRARRQVGRLLVTPMLVGGGAPWYGAAVLGLRFDDWSVFWSAVLVTTFASVFLVIALRLRHVVTWSLLAALTSLAAGVAAVAAVVQACEHPSLSALVTGGHGVPMLMLVVATIVVGLTVHRVTSMASAAFLLGVGLLIALPIEDSWPARGAFMTVAVAVVIAALTARRPEPWSRGGRLATGVASAGLLIQALPWIANLIAAIGDGANELGTAPFWQRAGIIDATPGPGWLAAVVFGALTLVVLLATRWPEASQLVPAVQSTGWLIGAAGVASAVAAGGSPYVVLAAVFVGVGLLLVEVLTSHQPGWSVVGVAVVAIAPVIPLVSRSAALPVWLLAAIVLSAIAMRSVEPWRRNLSTFSGAGWLMGAVGVAALVAGADDQTTSLVLVASAVVGLLIASVSLRDWPARMAVETATGVVAGIGLALAAGQRVDLFWQSVVWLVAGAGLVLLSFLTPDRRWFRWVGSGALGVAYVLRLVASDVEVVEAYTLPFGLALLVGGLWTMRRRGSTSSLSALGPAMTLLLLPSLPLALQEPASQRSVTLFVGALLIMLAGVRWHWKAPFVAGSVVLLVLAITNLGPYAWAVPRWVLIAGAGALLLGIGVSWEDRVRDGRRIAIYVRAMR